VFKAASSLPKHAARAGAPLRRALCAAALAMLQAALALPSLAADGAAVAPSAANADASKLAPCPAGMGSHPGVSLAPVSAATAALIRNRIKDRVGAPTSICRTPFGLYEVIVDDDLFYVDERGDYLFNGNVFDLRTHENLTEIRRDDAFRIDFAALPLDLAVKTVRGDGSRVVAIFEDPNCPYCKRFEKDIAKLTNATIYTFLYPILSRDVKARDDSYPKSMSIWCAPDRGAAWAQVMLEGRRLEAAPASCKHPLERILALGQKMHITGTPTLVFTDGRRAPGAVPLERVEQMMAEAAHPEKPAQVQTDGGSD
jgi:thiol:disulfide interchange protein DsbC